MGHLSALRCSNHGDREAASLCSRCRKAHCRECVTEHDGQVLCVACLALPAFQRRAGFGFGLAALSTLIFAVSFLSLVLLFALLGKALLRTPSTLHEGQVWSSEGGS